MSETVFENNETVGETVGETVQKKKITKNEYKMQNAKRIMKTRNRFLDFFLDHLQ